MFSLTEALGRLLRYELRLYARQRSAWANPLSFFLMVVAMFPMGISPKAAQLQAIGAGILWVSALLATLLAAEFLFKQDLEEGGVEQWLVSPVPLFLIVLVKVFAHWLVSGLTLVLLSPLLSLMLFLDMAQMKALFFTLLIGTPTMSLICSIGAALTVGIRQGGVLLSLIVLPLYVPVLIFGTSAVQSAAQGFSVSGQYALLGAMLVLALVLTPFATAMALRVSVEHY